MIKITTVIAVLLFTSAIATPKCVFKEEEIYNEAECSERVNLLVKNSNSFTVKINMKETALLEKTLALLEKEIGEVSVFFSKSFSDYIEKHKGRLAVSLSTALALANYGQSMGLRCLSEISKATTISGVYLASPIDLIPDFIPILGLADDTAILSKEFLSAFTQCIATPAAFAIGSHEYSLYVDFCKNEPNFYILKYNSN